MEISLIGLGKGKKGIIKRMNGGLTFQKKLASLNIRIGKTIKMVTKQPFKGPIVIEISDRKVTLGRGIASRIFIEVEK